ncbi:MAG: SusC/RagA family TonB-linked outer membrane protein [Bacteroidaceae bacterium]|nr:SusC/RagA family TonB-linked outer membrane protein [Prevotellaceae bacterium]MDY5632826.1 SusC/RagA family TonB-linked outer membrane protein [Bacteroidaceae bacterium]
MKTFRFFLVLALMAVAGSAFAQINRVSGSVSDEYGELPGVQIREVDASNRTVNATVSDGNGNFTMTVKDAQRNKLVITCVGMKPHTIKPITKQVYKILLHPDVKEMQVLNVVAKKMVKTSGLSIPEREISFSHQGLDAKEFEGLGITSVDEALQGRIAGLDIVSNSGDLGAGTQMRLRGASTVSTLTSNEPLIVVNGDIATDIDQTNFDVATATEEKFAELLKVNTEDILDIKVLKDASATAIWGTRGANGVIEITTKRGKRGPARVSYSGKLTATYQPAGIKMLNGDQYTMLMKEAYFNPHLSDTEGDIPEFNYNYDGFSEAYMYDNNTDWVDLVSQTGLRQNHYLSVTGGDEKTLFRLSGGYDHETGTIIKQVLNRFSTRMALDYYVSDRIKIISDFSLTYTDNDRNYDALLAHAYTKMPNLSPYYEYENGVPSNDYYYMLQNAAGGTKKLDDQKDNPNLLASANLAKFTQRTYNLAPRLELEYKLLGLDDSKHQLKYNGMVFINVSNQYDDKDYPQELKTINQLDAHSSYSYSAKSLSFTTRHSLNYVPKFKNEDHFMTMLARFELTSGSNSSQSTDASRLPSGISSPSAGGLIGGMGSGFGQWRSMSYLYTTHYSWKGRYMIDGTLRMDGTTKFGPNRRWVYSPALSARWNIIDEPFMQAVREKAKVSMLSVRPGWGRVSNQPGQDYLYMNKYTTGLRYLNTVSMNSSGLKLTNLGPEYVSSYNLGFDLGFFDDRIRFVLDLYSRKTSDMLMAKAGIPGSTGYSSLEVKNVGGMRNTGWEFNINGNRLLKKGKFSLDFYVNFANNRNVITSMDANILENLNNDFSQKNRDVLQRVQIDNPFGSIYGFRSKGVYQYAYSTAERIAKEDAKNGTHVLQDNIDRGMTYPIALNADGKVVLDEKSLPKQMAFCVSENNPQGLGRFNGGDAMYEDVNNDGQINELDIVYLGNSLPKLTGGFGLTLNYGRWRLGAQFNYRIDYDIYNLARLDMESMIGNNNQSQAVNYRWRKEGDVTSIPRAWHGSAGIPNYNTLVSDRFIEDGTFLRLNYLQLSYSFDNKLVKKWHMSGLKLYASANNLFCLTKYSGVDPEISYGGYGISTDAAKTPRSRSWTFGLNIEF